MGRHDRAQLRPVAPGPPDDRHPPVPQGVRAARPPLPGQGPDDRPRRALRARRVLDGHRLADPAHPGPRRGRLARGVLRAVPPGLRGRLHHRARGPPLRGHRREGQAGLPDRARRPAAVLPSERSMQRSIETPDRARHRQDDRPQPAAAGARRRVRRGRLPAGREVRRRVRVRPPGRRPARRGDPRRHRRRGRHDDRLPARQPPDRDQGVRGAAGARGRRHRARHGHPDRRAASPAATRTSRPTSRRSSRSPTPPARSSR